jgi:hypothetical protein
VIEPIELPDPGRREDRIRPEPPWRRDAPTRHHIGNGHMQAWQLLFALLLGVVACAVIIHVALWAGTQVTAWL